MAVEGPRTEEEVVDQAVYDEFVGRATAWLDANAERKPIASKKFVWGEGGDNIRLMGPEQADDEATALAAAADAIVLATSWTGSEAACRDMALAGPLAGKIVLDCTNPLVMGPAGRELAVAHTNSAGEKVASWCSGAHVYKAFNTVPAEVMVAPERMTVKPVVFVAGDGEAHKPGALKLVEDTGFEARDAGPIRNARMLEYLALLYLDLAMVRGTDQTGGEVMDTQIMFDALERITKLECEPFAFPTDWHDKISACSECQRYKDHPIQQGICDEHRKPIYARARHEDHQQRTLIYRAQDIAKETIAAARQK